MNHLRAALLCLITAAVAGCGPTAADYENLQNERDELYADSQGYQRQLTASEENHARTVTRLEGRIQDLNTQLDEERADAKILREDLRKIKEDYDKASEATMNAATSTIALIKEKRRLNETVVELEATIAGLENQIKDLRTRLAELSGDRIPDNSDLPELK